MKNILLKVKHKEDGVTLVELLAAIAILSIIVTSFLAFFIQSANTNKMTNEVNEATFLAQGEMELVTSYSMGNYTGEEVNVKFFNDEMKRTTVEKPYTIDTVLTGPNGESSLYKVVVTVSEGSKARAKMETRLPFEKEIE